MTGIVARVAFQKYLSDVTMSSTLILSKRITKTAMVFAATAILGSIESSMAADSVAPGAPGASANWTTGLKQGLGTAIGRDSKGVVYALQRSIE